MLSSGCSCHPLRQYINQLHSNTLCKCSPRIALGEKAEQNIAFYASLHDKKLSTAKESEAFYPDFSSPSMELIQFGAKPDIEDHDNGLLDPSGLKQQEQDMCSSIDKVAGGN